MYFSPIDSVSRYMTPVYGGTALYLTEQILRLQKRAIHLVTNSSYVAHTKPLSEKLNALCFYKLYAANLVISAHSHSLRLPSHQHGYATRFSESGLLRPTMLHRSEARKSPLPNFIRIFNKLPNVLRNSLENDCVSNHRFIVKCVKKIFHVDRYSSNYRRPDSLRYALLFVVSSLMR